MDGFRGGFLKASNIGWQDSTARAMAYAMQANVCAVDWSRLAAYLYTITALLHTHKVSNHIYEFIQVLEVNGADVGQMIIVGHSLGAQIAGYVGAALGGRLFAIYGLDPAGPGFRFPFSDKPSNRLDDTDAKYVQCIHTARSTLGVNYNCGHADFSPNGGFRMPGCRGMICSHLFVVKLFRSSLDKTHQFLGIQCPTDFLANLMKYQCSNITELMGIHNTGARGSFYLYTTSSDPYCMNCLPLELSVVPAHQQNLNRHRPSLTTYVTMPEQPKNAMPSLLNIIPSVLQAVVKVVGLPFNLLFGLRNPQSHLNSMNNSGPSMLSENRA